MELEIKSVFLIVYEDYIYNSIITINILFQVLCELMVLPFVFAIQIRVSE
jgi:hypothetical protein